MSGKDVLYWKMFPRNSFWRSCYFYPQWIQSTYTVQRISHSLLFNKYGSLQQILFIFHQPSPKLPSFLQPNRCESWSSVGDIDLMETIFRFVITPKIRITSPRCMWIHKIWQNYIYSIMTNQNVPKRLLIDIAWILPTWASCDCLLAFLVYTYGNLWRADSANTICQQRQEWGS